MQSFTNQPVLNTAAYLGHNVLLDVQKLEDCRGILGSIFLAPLSQQPWCTRSACEFNALGKVSKSPHGGWQDVWHAGANLQYAHFPALWNDLLAGMHRDENLPWPFYLSNVVSSPADESCNRVSTEYSRTVRDGNQGRPSGVPLHTSELLW